MSETKAPVLTCLTDAEADAQDAAEAGEALLALGGVLTWSPKQIGSYIGTPNGTLLLYVLGAHASDYGYSIYEKEKQGKKIGWQATCSLSPQQGQGNLTLCPSLLPSEFAAKAACERHYATGQWE